MKAYCKDGVCVGKRRPSKRFKVLLWLQDKSFKGQKESRLFRPPKSQPYSLATAPTCYAMPLLSLSCLYHSLERNMVKMVEGKGRGGQKKMSPQILSVQAFLNYKEEYYKKNDSGKSSTNKLQQNMQHVSAPTCSNQQPPPPRQKVQKKKRLEEVANSSVAPSPQQHGEKPKQEVAAVSRGRNVNDCDTKRRQTYKPPTLKTNGKESIVSTVYCSEKLLAPASFHIPGNGGIGYKESLMRFVKGLGPIAQKIASQKLANFTPTSVDYASGSIESQTVGTPILNRPYGYDHVQPVHAVSRSASSAFLTQCSEWSQPTAWGPQEIDNSSWQLGGVKLLERDGWFMQQEPQFALDQHLQQPNDVNAWVQQPNDVNAWVQDMFAAQQSHVTQPGLMSDAGSSHSGQGASPRSQN